MAFTLNRNNKRINSDDISLIIKSGDGKVINVTNDFGLTDISINSRDDLEVWTPFNKLSPESRVLYNGYDLQLTFKKENYDYLYEFFIGMSNLFLGQLPMSNLNFGFDNIVKENTNIFTQNRIEEKSINNAGFGSSINDNNSNIHYFTPKFDLIININHSIIVNNQEYKTESMIYKDTTFYKPTFKVSENTSDIEYSISAFSSFCLQGSRANSYLSKLLMNEYQKNFNEVKNNEKLPFLKRVITYNKDVKLKKQE